MKSSRNYDYLSMLDHFSKLPARYMYTERKISRLISSRFSQYQTAISNILAIVRISRFTLIFYNTSICILYTRLNLIITLSSAKHFQSSLASLNLPDVDNRFNKICCNSTSQTFDYVNYYPIFLSFVTILIDTKVSKQSMLRRATTMFRRNIAKLKELLGVLRKRTIIINSTKYYNNLRV